MTSERAARLRHALSRPMLARDINETHRAATPLELLFDLCFVVAVAVASDRLHHAISEGHVTSGVIGYLMVFFAIWWAWMNFTWFASAYDTDDVAYRLATFVQISGVLILAAGVSRAFDARDFTLIVVGYTIIRAGLISQWLRAAHADADGRRTAVRFATGLTACMVGWTAILVVPDAWRIPVFVAMAAAELAVPVWAERARRTAWHPHHIAERYGLFTLIVLGETVLAATTAIKSALEAETATTALISVAGCGLVIVFAMWWVYFGQHAQRILRSNREGFRWGYGHYLIFSSAAAVGAGLGVAVDYNTHVAHISRTIAGAAVAVPVAAFLLSVWLLHVRPHRPRLAFNAALPVAALLVLASAATPAPLPVTAALMAALGAACVVLGERAV